MHLSPRHAPSPQGMLDSAAAASDPAGQQRGAGHSAGLQTEG